MILWSLLSRTGWLTHCQAHLSLSTAEHVLMSLFCPGKTFFSSPSTQISTIKAQMTTPPCYPPWLQLQKNNFCFPLMPIESHLNDSLLHLLVNLLIGQRRLLNQTLYLKTGLVKWTCHELKHLMAFVTFVPFVLLIHIHFDSIPIYAKWFKDKKHISVLILQPQMLAECFVCMRYGQ